MLQERIHWLIDQNLPRLSGRRLDSVHLAESGRDILTEALMGGRAVVTANRYLLDSRTIPFNCPPIVVVDSGYLTPEALQRNLLHFEFCLLHEKHSTTLEGQRFLIEIDRAIYRLRPDGALEELETWKVPSVRLILALDAPT
jgi:hypothetical protein